MAFCLTVAQHISLFPDSFPLQTLNEALTSFAIPRAPFSFHLFPSRDAFRCLKDLSVMEWWGLLSVLTYTTRNRLTAEINSLWVGAEQRFISLSQNGPMQVGNTWGTVGTLLHAFTSLLSPWVWECCVGWATRSVQANGVRNRGGLWAVPGAGAGSCIPHFHPYSTGSSSVMGSCLIVGVKEEDKTWDLVAIVSPCHKPFTIVCPSRWGRNTVVLPYLWKLHFETPSGRLEPPMVQNPIYTMFFLCIHTYDKV